MVWMWHEDGCLKPSLEARGTPVSQTLGSKADSAKGKVSAARADVRNKHRLPPVSEEGWAAQKRAEETCTRFTEEERGRRSQQGSQTGAEGRAQRDSRGPCQGWACEELAGLELSPAWVGRACSPPEPSETNVPQSAGGIKG